LPTEIVVITLAGRIAIIIMQRKKSLSNSGEQPKLISKMDLVIAALINNAIGGDNAAISMVFERLEGKVAQSIVGPNNGAVQIELNTI
jgi:hypothetical protein